MSYMIEVTKTYRIKVDEKDIDDAIVEAIKLSDSEKVEGIKAEVVSRFKETAA